MAYVKKTLAHEERYIYRAKFNWTYDAASIFWFVLGLSPSILRTLEAAGVIASADAQFGPAFNAFTAAAGVIGAVIAFTRYVHKWTTVIAVTSSRLILKSGLVSRITAEMTLDKIEKVIVHQTFLGRILGYGHLTVRGTGVSEIEFPDLADPVGFRRHIEEAMTAVKAD